MTPRRWYAIATLIMLVTVPAFSSAANRLAASNPGCEIAGDDPTDIPGWTNHRGSPTPRLTARVDAIGVGQTAACVIVGPGTLVSGAFAVTGGDEIVAFTADVWEMRDDDPMSTGTHASDSVVVIDFSGGAASFAIHCDDLEDARDNGAFDGSERCSALDEYVAVEAKNLTTDFECDSDDLDVIDAFGNILSHRCAKYDAMICNHTDPMRNDEDCVSTGKAGGCGCVAAFPNPLFVPLGETSATVTLGGALATDSLFLAGLESPTTVTAFDNVYVE